MPLEFAVLGSCVSRDAVEFAQDTRCVRYIARSSIVSVVGKKPDEGELNGLVIAESAHRFHRECIEHDVNKTGLEELRKNGCPVIIDLIEERVPLGVMPSGSIVTLSQAADAYSNLTNFAHRTVKAFSDEHLELFERSLPSLAVALSGKRVIVHRSMYAENVVNRGENAALDKMYSMLVGAIDKAVAITPDHSISSEHHKWGHAPYHYVDRYYVSFIEKLGKAIGVDIQCKTGFTLQKGS